MTQETRTSEIDERPLPAQPATRRGGLPLVVVGLVVAVGTGAYFVGRGSATPPPRENISDISSSASESAEQNGAETGGSGETSEAKEGKASEGGAKETGEAGEAGKASESGVIKFDTEAAEAAGIRVEPVRFALSRDVLTAPGTVEVSPNRGAKVTPPAPGRIVQFLATIGDTVRAGQPLAVIDSAEVAAGVAAVREAQSGVQQASAQVQTAQAGADRARTRQSSAEAALKRQRELSRTGAFSQPSLQAAQNELTDAEAERDQALTALQAATTVASRAERLFKDELVARTELEQAQTAQKQEETRVGRAEKRVATARQAQQREERVFRGGLLSKQVVQTADAEVRAARAEVRQSEQEVAAARTALAGARTRLSATQESLRAVQGGGQTGKGASSRLTLRAPIGGVITARNVTLGEAVERGAEIFVIENLGAVVVEARVPEAEVARIQVGRPVEVTVASYPGIRFSGVVETIGGRVDEKTRSLPVRCLVSNPGGRLRPEMFAQVTLAVSGSGKGATSLAVPTSAIAQNGEERFVFVQVKDGYEKRVVRLGRKMGARIEILDGLKPGELVANEGVFVLKSESMKDELKGDED